MARGVRLNAVAGAPAWVALGALLAGGAGAGALVPTSALDWQPHLAWREPWRLFSAAFVHWSAPHLAVNLLGTAVVAAWGWVARVPRAAALAWALAWPLTHAALALQPQIAHYGGLSGVLHAGVAVVAVHLLRHARGTRRGIAAAVLCGLAAKVVLEAPWRGALQASAAWDFALAPLAHAAGAVAGTVLGTWAAWRTPRSR